MKRYVAIALIIIGTVFLLARPAKASTQLINTIPLGSSPGQVAIDSSRGYVYISSTDNHAHTIWMVDEVTNQILKSVSLGPVNYNSLGGIAVNTQTNRLYVADFFHGQIFVLDSQTLATITTISLPVPGFSGSEPFGVTVSQKQNRIYVTDAYAGAIHVIDGATNQLIDTVSTTSRLFGVTIDDQLDRLYATTYYANTALHENILTVFDTSSDRVVTTLPVGTAQTAMVGVDTNNHKIYVADYNTTYVTVVDGLTNTVLKDINVSMIPFGIAIDTTTNQVFVNGSSPSSLVRIDGSTDSVAQTLSTGDVSGQGVAADPTTHKIVATYPLINGYINIFAENIDNNPPTITAAFSPAADSNGWNNSDLTISFNCIDDVEIASCTGPVAVKNEGANQSVIGTAIDTSGNTTSTTATVNLDKTSPNISYAASPSPNSFGWNNTDVTVSFTCDDALSGIDTCSNPVALSNEVDNQVATGTAVDKAGNSSTVTDIVRIDKTAPNITYSLSQAANSDGWNNSDVTVTFHCSDALSGVATCPDPVNVGEGGGQIITGTAMDKAGNSASTSVMLSIDETAPQISYTLSQNPNTDGWNNSTVTVTFNCADSFSGVNSCTSPVTLTNDGGNQSVTGTATDVAGNTSTVTATVNLDKTAPQISYTVSPTPNTFGWNNSDTTVSFTCSDTTSGVKICPAAITLGEGGGQIVTAAATDYAGNSSSTSVMVNIDKTTPSIAGINWSVNPVQQGQNTTLMASVSDSLSGVSSVSYTVNGSTPQAMTTDPISGSWIATFGSNLSANTYNITVTATDTAGNISASTNDVLVVYTTANGYVNGHAKTLPTTQDTMPIALDTSNNPTQLALGFTNVTAPMSGSFDMDYKIKNNQNEFSLSSTSINWVVVEDSTHASILGRADMTVHSNGKTTVTQNMSVRYDITLGTNGNPDQITIKILNPADNPNTGTPAYTINDVDIPNSSNLMIHP